MIQHYQGVRGHGHTIRGRSELTSASLPRLREDAFHNRQPRVPFLHLLGFLAAKFGTRAQGLLACVRTHRGVQNRGRDLAQRPENRHRCLCAVCERPVFEALCASAKRSDPCIWADLFTTVAHAKVDRAQRSAFNTTIMLLR